MNKDRRKRLMDICSQLEEVLTEEQAALDALPENLQESPQADAMQEAVDSMEEAVEAITHAADEELGG